CRDDVSVLQFRHREFSRTLQLTSPRAWPSEPRALSEINTHFRFWLSACLWLFPGQERHVTSFPKVQGLYTMALRLIVGFGSIAHGYAKLARGPENFAAILHALGVPAPHWTAWLTILVEIGGGLAVLTGAFVALASIPMAAVLLTAMFTVHLPY